MSVSEPVNKKRPIWILSVKWKMEGIEVNLDTSIGKWMSKLADTVTRLAETQNNNNEVGSGGFACDWRRFLKLKFFVVVDKN